MRARKHSLSTSDLIAKWLLLPLGIYVGAGVKKGGLSSVYKIMGVPLEVWGQLAEMKDLWSVCSFSVLLALACASATSLLALRERNHVFVTESVPEPGGSHARRPALERKKKK